MQLRTYGVIDETKIDDKLEQHLEELTILGYTIVEDVLNREQLEMARAKLDEVYRQQEEELGSDHLSKINELDLARCPLAYDDFFLDLAAQKQILEIAHGAIGGGYIVLNQQNGIINRPNREHHQSAWHRDLPYQEFVSSKPLAVGALYCIDDFTMETGATHVLPHTHRVEKMPSPHYVEKHQIPVIAQAGSVLVFDSMLYHRAGHNSSTRIRRALNNVYTVPIIRQQISLPQMLNGRHSDDPFLKKLLGYESGSFSTVSEYRRHRYSKI